MEVLDEQYVQPKDKYYYLERALNFLFAIYFIFAGVNEFIDSVKGSTLFLILAIPFFCFVCFLFANYPAKLIVLVIMIAAALFSMMKYVMSWIFKMMPSSSNSKTQLHCLVRRFMTEEAKNIIGDLSEEYSQFQSKPKAYVWLLKQILTSIPPLLYNNLKCRLTSYFGEWLR